MKTVTAYITAMLILLATFLIVHAEKIVFNHQIIVENIAWFWIALYGFYKYGELIWNFCEWNFELKIKDNDKKTGNRIRYTESQIL